MEKRFGLTRACIEALSTTDLRVEVLTKSPLVLRDLDVLAKCRDIEVGLTVTTDDEGVRRIFEPKAPPIRERLRTLKALHEKGIPTYVFVGPMLPSDPDRLAEQVLPYADHFLIDRMNYLAKTIGLFRRHGLQHWLDSDYVDHMVGRLRSNLSLKPAESC